MDIVLPNTDSIAAGFSYKVKGSSGTVTYNGNTYNIDDEFDGVTDVFDYSNTGDAYVTGVHRFFGLALTTPIQIDELTYNEYAVFKGVSIEVIPQQDEFSFAEKTRVRGVGLEVLPIRYYTTKKFIKTY